MVIGEVVMKKIIGLVITLILLTALVSCNQKNGTSYVGLNAEIIAINSELRGFTVKGDGTVLGEKCYINLEGDDIYYIYADNETGETQYLEYSDFIEGDIITVDTDTVENKCALATRIQLLTQRLP